MRKISAPVMEKILEEKQQCSLIRFGGCAGRLTLEHTLTYNSKQIDEAWAIIWLCARHHGVDEYQDNGELDKEKNVWVALNKATDEELEKYSKAIPYVRERARLNEVYGPW